MWLPTLIPVVVAGIIAVIIAIWVWFQPIDGGKVGDHPLARWGCAAVILLLVAPVDRRLSGPAVYLRKQAPCKSALKLCGAA